MKILQIINSLGTGGAEKLMLDTIPLYREAGIEMDILILWNNNHQFVASLQALDCCNVYILNNSSKIKDIYHPKNIFKIRKYLKNYDIAHVHLFPAQYYAVIANMLNGNSCKLIFTEHSTFNKRMNKPLLKNFEKIIYKGYKKIIAISDGVEQALRNHLISLSPKVLRIENGVNLKQIQDTKVNKNPFISIDLNLDDILLTQVSAFRVGKDQITLIKALNYLPKNYKVVLVGDGEERKEFELLVQKLNLVERVKFLGIRMDVHEILKSSNLVILSSKFEGLSLSSIEGMASGKPFIASNVPGLKEIVEDAGVLFECGNEVELASKITELLADKVYYDKVVETCLERAKQYDISIMIQKHIDLYQSVYEN